MLVKNFEGFSVSQVMKEVKKEFGSNAIILETNHKTSSDGKVQLVEIKAATADKSSLRSGASLARERSSDTELLTQRLTNIEFQMEKMLQTIATTDQFDSIADGLREVKLLVSDSRLDSMEIKGLPKELNQIYQQLAVNGVQTSYTVELLRFLKKQLVEKKEQLQDYGSLEDFYRSQAIRWMLNKSKVMEFNKGFAHSKVVAFIGPSGSGKTSTVIKFASFIKRKLKKDVQIVSYEPDLVGSIEKIKILTKIFTFPHHVVCDYRELNNCIAKLPEQSVILLDTAGVNPNCMNDVKQLASVLNSEIPIDCHLVLPALEKYLQLDRYVDYFGSCRLQSLIFTKLDCCWQYGDIFNINAKWPLPISFFSTNPTIPDGFEIATKERIVERIFGL